MFAFSTRCQCSALISLKTLVHEDSALYKSLVQDRIWVNKWNSISILHQIVDAAGLNFSSSLCKRALYQNAKVLCKMNNAISDPDEFPSGHKQ